MAYKTTTLDGFVTLQRGYDLPVQDRAHGNIPVIAASGQVGFHNIPKVTTQTVVLGRSGSIGNPQLIAEPFWPLNTTLFVKDFHGNLPSFVYYVLKTIDFKSFDAGGTVPTLNRNHLTQIKVPLVDALRQKAIGEVLGNLDSKIAANSAISRTLEEIARSFFKSWFIDFDPVKAKMAGEVPVGMDAETAALFPDSMEESELGEIPKGWASVSVKDLCSQLSNGSTPARSNEAYWSEPIIDWYKTGELRDNFLLHASEGISQQGIDGSSVRVLPAGSVLMAIYAAPTVGRLGILTEESVFNQACTGLVPKPEVGTPFLYLTLKNLRGFFINRSNGAAQQNISKQIVEAAPCISPLLEILKGFNEICGPIFELWESLTKENAILAQTRDSLLPRLISGELEIPDELLAA